MATRPATAITTTPADMLRITKILLILTVALWGALSAIHNLLAWDGTLGAVRAATSMATFDGGPENWQATSSSMLVWAGAVFIVGAKLLTCLLCLVGGVNMWQARAHSQSAFDQAKKAALTGCAVATLMLFGGFIVIAETWFELWRSDAMRGPVLGSALRYGAMITLVGIFVGQSND